MNRGVLFYFSDEDIYKGGRDGGIALYFLPLTSVTPMDDDNSVSNLNTCQTNDAKNRGINSFNENKTRIADALRQTGISEKDLNDFMGNRGKLYSDKRNPMVLLKECLRKLEKKFAVRYMNYNGYADKDFVGVLRDNEINFLYSFTNGTGYKMKIWGDNFYPNKRDSLKTILHDKDDPKTVNLAKNFREFLNQGEELYKLTDFEFLKQDVFIERCKGSKNDDDEFTIYDAEGELNEIGQLIYDKLCENLSNRISQQKILQHLKNYAKLTVSACYYNCREIVDYIDEVCGALIYKFNKDRFFSEEIYEPVKIRDGLLNDSFATIHYFQCIVTACIMHFLSADADANTRKNIIDGIIKVRTDFEEMTLDNFKASEYALNLAPAEKVKFIIKKFCGNDIAENVLEKILNTTTNIYADLFSNAARQVVSGTHYHTTQFIFLNSKDLFIEKNGEVKVPFPILYEVVTGKKLNLSQEVMDAYRNFDTSNPELFDYEVTIDKLKGKEINNISVEDLVENIALLKPAQLKSLNIDKILQCISYVLEPERNYTNERRNNLFSVFVNINIGTINNLENAQIVELYNYIDSNNFKYLGSDKISECISYIQAPERNYSNEKRSDLLRVFVNLSPYIINYLTAQQIVELCDYMDINHCNMNNNKLIDLVNYIKRGNNVPISLSEKVFKLLTNNNTVKRNFINDEEFFAKIVEFQNVIEFDKFFERRYDRFRLMRSDVGNDDLLNNFLKYLVNNIENANAQRLVRGPFLNLYRDNFLKVALIKDILEFFRDVEENSFSKFPNERVEELIDFIRKNKTHQDAGLAKSILMQKIKYYPEYILYFTPEEIETDYSYIGARTLKYLSAEKFTNLINYFLDKKNIGFEWLKKVLATSYFNRDLFRAIQPQQIFDLIIYCQINDSDFEKQERLKLYFNDLYPSSAKNVDFLKYVAGKVSEVSKYILKIVPQALNYVPIEQIYNRFDYFSDLIDGKFTHFNDLVNFVYDKKDDNSIKILQKILKNNPTFINGINNCKNSLDLMEKDEDLLNVVATKIENSKFSMLIRFGKDNYSINEMPENIKSIFLSLIEKNLFGNKSFYNFDFDSRIFVTKLYFDSEEDEEKTKTLLKNFLLDSKYIFETIKYVKNNSNENNFVNTIKEVISSEFTNLPAEAMLELSILDENYKNEFISIFPSNISSDYVFIEILNKYENLITDMLQNEDFETKLSDYINSKISNDNLLKLCKISNENIKNLISKDKFIDLINSKPDKLNIIVNYFNRYADDLSDEILTVSFTNNEFAVVRAASDKRFKEILLNLDNKKNLLDLLFVRYRDFISKEEIEKLDKECKNDVSSLLEKLDKKIEAKKKTEVTVKSEAKEEEEKRQREEEEKRSAKIKDKNEPVVKENENTEGKQSHKKRNVVFIIAGVVTILASITLLPLALLGFLPFGIGLGVAGGLFAIGTLITGFGSKFFDNEEINELGKRDPKTYTKTERIFYGHRQFIKDRIVEMEQNAPTKKTNDEPSII